MGSVAALAIGVLAFSSLGLHDAASSVAPERVVPLRMTPPMSATNAFPSITVSVGRDRPINLLFDSGSVGIRIFSKDLPTGRGSGIRVTAHRDRGAFGNGFATTGVIARAQISIDGLSTPSIPIELIRSTSCTPNCDGGSLGGTGPGRISGVFGAALSGPTSSDPAVNPLESLPAPYNGTWSIQLGEPPLGAGAGTLALGASIPVGDVAALRLRSLGTAQDGTHLWNDLPTVCWNFGNLAHACMPSLFDTGTPAMLIQSRYLPRTLASKGTAQEVLPAGVPITAAVPEDMRIFWSFNSGSSYGNNLVGAQRVDPTYVNTGFEAFQANTVTYDVLSGRLLFSSP